MAAGLLALASPLAAEQAPRCGTAAACVEALVEASARRDWPGREAIEQRLLGFGDGAADLLVARLAGGGDAARAAGMTLASFERIDPRHLPALAAAYSAGNAWLPRAIAATGTDEAFDLLTAAFLNDPSLGSNAQVHFALARFGEARLRPFVTARFEACRNDLAGTAPELCRGLAELLGELPSFPAWGLEALASVARSPAAEDEVRQGAEYELVRQRHSAGLAALVRDMEQARSRLPPNGPIGGSVSDSWLSTVIRDIGDYGPAAREAEALLLWALGRPQHRDSRAAAALALGLIGTEGAAPALAALEPAFADDWLLAYNSVESLGRLRAAGAQPLLARVAQSHWYAPVRNNARRALNLLAGGAFEQPGVPRDGAPFEEGDVPGETFISGSSLRYKGDRDLPRWCSARRGASTPFEQSPLAAIAWPRTGSRFLAVRGLSDEDARPLRARIPGLDARARITVHVPTATGALLGESRGDWGGRLLHVDERGGVSLLFDEPPEFAYRLGGRLYVGSGTSHALTSHGDLWEIDAEGPRVLRRIRLPAETWRIAATRSHALVFETGAGALAMREDGSLADPAALGPCTP